MKALTILAALLLPTGTGLVRAEKPAARPVAVPFKLLPTKHMTVDIKLNGKGPYKVIFDTGAPITLINMKAGREAGLVDKNARKQGFGLFATLGPATIQSLEVGNLKAEGIQAIVMDHPTVELISQRLGPIYGIVGFPFFARYKMTLDYQAQEMTFVPNGYDPPDVLQSMMASVMSVSKQKGPVKKILAPAALWGLKVGKEKDDAEAGVTILEVFPGGAADKAGLKPGDRLLTLDGRWTDTVADCYAAAGYVKPGSEAAVTIRRGKLEMERTVRPAAGL